MQSNSEFVEFLWPGNVVGCGPVSETPPRHFWASVARFPSSAPPLAALHKELMICTLDPPHPADTKSHDTGASREPLFSFIFPEIFFLKKEFSFKENSLKLNQITFS